MVKQNEAPPTRVRIEIKANGYSLAPGLGLLWLIIPVSLFLYFACTEMLEKYPPRWSVRSEKLK